MAWHFVNWNLQWFWSRDHWLPVRTTRCQLKEDKMDINWFWKNRNRKFQVRKTTFTAENSSVRVIRQIHREVTLCRNTSPVNGHIYTSKWLILATREALTFQVRRMSEIKLWNVKHIWETSKMHQQITKMCNLIYFHSR